MTITDTPLLRVKEPAHFGSIAYESLYGKNWYTSDMPEKVWDSGFKQYPALEAVEVANVKSIYSTRRHPIGVIPEDVAAWIADQKAKVNA